MIGLKGISFSPETLIMLPLALGIDASSFIVGLFGLPDCGIPDIVGIAFINPWMFIRGYKGSGKKTGMFGFINQIVNGKYSRYIATPMLEAVPYLDILPFWTARVIMTLMEGGDEEAEAQPEPQQASAEMEELNAEEPEPATRESPDNSSAA
jgi:hypothetical protein